MDASDRSWAIDGAALDAGAGRDFPRVLFVPQDGVTAAGTGSVIAESLAGEGWTTTVHGTEIDTAPASTRPLLWVPARFRLTVRRFSRLLLKLRSCDVVHIPCGSSGRILRQAIPTLILARFFGKRPLLHFVSAEIEPLLERYRRWLIPVLRLADTAVVGSRYLQKVLGRIGVPVRMVTQPVALDGITHRVRRKPQPKILVNTSLEPDLNVQLAIKAFRLVKQKYPRCELVVVGDGSERVDLERWVARNRLYGVEFKGAAGKDEVLRMYQECDLFLHTPLVDESPPALVRAFAAGLPVVTTDADGILHMVRDRVNALLVPMGDHVGLADAVIELIENQQLCESLSAQGQAEAEKYVWARVRQDWVNLYKGMVT